MKSIFFRNPFILLLACLSVLGFKATDDYFEISKNLEIFADVYKTVNEHYVEEVKPGELMRTGIDAMLNSLDPYTNFYSEAQAEDALMRQRGEYGGLGISVIKDGDYIVVSDVRAGYASAKEDIRIGDKFLTVNAVNVKGMSIDEIGNHLKGEVGAVLKLSIDRPGIGTIEKTVKREKIEVKNVSYAKMIGDQIGLIKLDQFMINSATEVEEALKKMKSDPNFKGLILDLRNNGGGLLRDAVSIVNFFVPENQTVVTTKGRKVNNRYATTLPPIDTELPLVVLINRHSASASEIVSGGLQDFDRAVIIGENSFGKGLVQHVRNLKKYRTQVKVTIAKYYTPSGRCIQLKDYSHRNEDGSAKILPDSLRKSFKTKNGRVVKDGGGVYPDILIKAKSYSPFVQQLIKEKHLFHFANLYRNQHDSISSAKTFRLTTSDFSNFVASAKEKGFKYKSQTSEALAQLQEKAKEEDKEAELLPLIEQMSALEDALTQKEYDRNKSDLMTLLEEEITKRYYFDDALLDANIEKDEHILKAKEVLLSDSNRAAILNPGNH